MVLVFTLIHGTYDLSAVIMDMYVFLVAFWMYWKFLPKEF